MQGIAGRRGGQSAEVVGNSSSYASGDQGQAGRMARAAAVRQGDSQAAPAPQPAWSTSKQQQQQQQQQQAAPSPAPLPWHGLGQARTGVHRAPTGLANPFTPVPPPGASAAPAPAPASAAPVSGTSLLVAAPGSAGTAPAASAATSAIADDPLNGAGPIMSFGGRTYQAMARRHTHAPSPQADAAALHALLHAIEKESNARVGED
eukprot:1141997-Pelagomonas_calceolata.AAC.2